MATDATGTPTAMGIPKFNTAVDSPSGNGGNAQMDKIDALLTNDASVRGTTFPASPVDGQFFELQVDTTNGIMWMFKYRSGSASSFKWEFVGGAPATSFVATSESTSSGSYVDLTTVGPSITLPRAGDYLVRWGATVIPTTAVEGLVAVKQGAAATADANAAVFHPGAGTTLQASVSREFVFTGAAASDVYKLQYKNSAATACSYSNRWLSITPVRCS